MIKIMDFVMPNKVATGDYWLRLSENKGFFLEKINKKKNKKSKKERVI